MRQSGTRGQGGVFAQRPDTRRDRLQVCAKRGWWGSLFLINQRQNKGKGQRQSHAIQAWQGKAGRQAAGHGACPGEEVQPLPLQCMHVQGKGIKGRGRQGEGRAGRGHSTWAQNPRKKGKAKEGQRAVQKI